MSRKKAKTDKKYSKFSTYLRHVSAYLIDHQQVYTKRKLFRYEAFPLQMLNSVILLTLLKYKALVSGSGI
jgi:hypothetical protein